jgi:protein-S-isoprenylcysteine O-methyltransferase Ste14
LFNRIVLSKMLAVLLLAATAFAAPVYAEGSAPEVLLNVAGFLLLMLAAFGRTWASLFIAGQKNSRVVSAGPYSIVRHPLYLFSLMGFVGAGLVLESLLVAAGLVAVFTLTHRPAMQSEEQRLLQLFGDEYRQYMERVPRMVPRFASYQAPAEVEVDTRRFGRALVEAALIMLVFPIAAGVELAREQGLLPGLFPLF